MGKHEREHLVISVGDYCRGEIEMVDGHAFVHCYPTGKESPLKIVREFRTRCVPDMRNYLKSIDYHGYVFCYTPNPVFMNLSIHGWEVVQEMSDTITLYALSEELWA